MDCFGCLKGSLGCLAGWPVLCWCLDKRGGGSREKRWSYTFSGPLLEEGSALVILSTSYSKLTKPSD